MTINLAKQSLAAMVLSSALLGGQMPAHAAGHELWREQVPSAQSHRTVLSQSARYARHESSALWREQVKPSGDGYLPVFSVKRVGDADGSYLLWREQIPAGASRGKLIAQE